MSPSTSTADTPSTMPRITSSSATNTRLVEKSLRNEVDTQSHGKRDRTKKPGVVSSECKSTTDTKSVKMKGGSKGVTRRKPTASGPDIQSIEWDEGYSVSTDNPQTDCDKETFESFDWDSVGVLYTDELPYDQEPSTGIPIPDSQDDPWVETMIKYQIGDNDIDIRPPKWWHRDARSGIRE
ncbi:hypothetical protein L486_05426 [Kwoniella mangroviensis CBS 10435]|uniref:Uncharacterized protein n=1 Tax=Kwoniella mangroviensis CBS 10435 TaxID=1331196 RepID=A0A1B9ILX3_9TREE|nr:hypothetical protein L486_05426 [Kwoniella mangroviensis CBS 10435]